MNDLISFYATSIRLSVKNYNGKNNRFHTGNITH